MNIAIITGASSGLGQEFAKRIDRLYRGIDEIWLIARRKERLEELQKELKLPSRILALDLSKKQDQSVISDSLKNVSSPKICVLVNAAGFGIIGSVEDMDYEKVEGMLDVNVKALTAISSICLPYLRRNSIVYQIASSAAFMPQPSFAVYAASKSYVLSYSLALREELRHKGVRVIAVCPGPVATEFFDIAENQQKMGAYKNWFMAKKEGVVCLAMQDAKHSKAMSVYGFPMQLFRFLTKILPNGLLLRMVQMLSDKSTKEDNFSNSISTK